MDASSWISLVVAAASLGVAGVGFAINGRRDAQAAQATADEAKAKAEALAPRLHECERVVSVAMERMESLCNRTDEIRDELSGMRKDLRRLLERGAA